MVAPLNYTVLLHSRPVGDLERGGRGLRLSFRGEYLDDEARVPLSLSLPAETGPHRGDAVARWIDGLLPGRREVRERWRDHYGAASTDAFDLLSTRVGHDCAGAVRFSAESGEGALWDRPGGVRWLSEEVFEDLILEMSRHPHWWGSSPSADGFSLAGAFEIAGFITEHSAYPPRELEAFYRQLVYRWAAGDADGHAKNYTLLLTADDARLAPLYDSWSQPVRDPRHAMSHRMAMWVGDDGRLLAGDDEDYWREAANTLGVRPRAAVKILSAVKDRFADAAEQAVSELPDDGTVEQPAERFRTFARSRF